MRNDWAIRGITLLYTTLATGRPFRTTLATRRPLRERRAQPVERRRQLRVGCGIALARAGRLRDADVGAYADAIEIAPLGRRIARGRQFERAAVGQRKDRLHQTLSEGTRPEHTACTRILHGAGDDLGRRRGVAVDQQRQRSARVRRARRARDGRRSAAFAHRVDRPRRDERGGDGRRFVAVAAAVRTQIEHGRARFDPAGDGAEIGAQRKIIESALVHAFTSLAIRS